MHLRMNRWLLLSSLILVVSGLASTMFAQQDQPPEPAEDTGQQDGAPMGQMDQMDQIGQMGQASPEMREMARSMKSMADMCQVMMEREMAYRPYWVTAGVSVGVLLVVSLVLFIILEVQWIRFWSVRIKTERQRLG